MVEDSAISVGVQDMKILIDGRFYGLEHAGIGRYSMNLIDELAKQDRQNEYVVLLAPKYFKLLKFPRNWTKVNVPFRHYTITEQVKLPFIIAKHKPDLCHFLHFNVPVFYFGKFVVTLHDMEMHKSQGKEATTRDFLSYRLWRLGYKFVFANAARRSAKIIVPTKVVRNEIANYYKLPKKKFEVAYEGVGSHFFKPVNQKVAAKILKKFGLVGRKYFFYNGNAYPHKNLPVAIEAIKKLGELFVIASSRSVFTKRLESEIKNMDAQKHVKLLGFVTDDELRALHQNAIAFVYPSLMEGFGLQGLEAMASGSFLCASDIPIFREIYKDNALYFDPHSEEAVADALTKALDMEPNERRDRLTKATKHVKNFTWEKMAKKTLATYKTF